MAHLSDEELKDLKSRVATAMGTGASIARSNELMYQLIVEVEEHRAGPKAPPVKPKIGILKVGEMDVKRAEPPPPPSEKNIPTTQMTPEETKELVEKTRPKTHEKGKKK